MNHKYSETFAVDTSLNYVKQWCFSILRAFFMVSGQVGLNPISPKYTTVDPWLIPLAKIEQYHEASNLNNVLTII